MPEASSRGYSLVFSDPLSHRSRSKRELYTVELLMGCASLQVTAYKLGAAPALSTEQAQLMRRVGIAAAAMECAARLLVVDDSPAAVSAVATLGHAAADVLARLAHQPLPELLRPQVRSAHVSEAVGIICTLEANLGCCQSQAATRIIRSTELVLSSQRTSPFVKQGGSMLISSLWSVQSFPPAGPRREPDAGDSVPQPPDAGRAVRRPGLRALTTRCRSARRCGGAGAAATSPGHPGRHLCAAPYRFGPETLVWISG